MSDANVNVKKLFKQCNVATSKTLLYLVTVF